MGIEVGFDCAVDGDVICEGEKILKIPGEEVTLEAEKRGWESTEGKPWSRYSGGVVSSLTGPERPA
jgi:hypothetical protein